MTKQQMFELMARKAHLTKKAARDAVDTFLDEVKRALSKGEKVVLSGFGTFKIVSVKDKPVIIPGTKIRKIVKGHRAARFTPGKSLKKAVK
ncbi:HU family DNA-binding protein [Candidatus Amesbacteria bacterium]|nr:HU family DNA-binding protein [Candidatus Amesbacteria bacterium]